MKDVHQKELSEEEYCVVQQMQEAGTTAQELQMWKTTTRRSWARRQTVYNSRCNKQEGELILKLKKTWKMMTRWSFPDIQVKAEQTADKGNNGATRCCDWKTTIKQPPKGPAFATDHGSNSEWCMKKSITEPELSFVDRVESQPQPMKPLKGLLNDPDLQTKGQTKSGASMRRVTVVLQDIDHAIK